VVVRLHVINKESHCLRIHFFLFVTSARDSGVHVLIDTHNSVLDPMLVAAMHIFRLFMIALLSILEFKVIHRVLKFLIFSRNLGFFEQRITTCCLFMLLVIMLVALQLLVIP